MKEKEIDNFFRSSLKGKVHPIDDADWKLFELSLKKPIAYRLRKYGLLGILLLILGLGSFYFHSPKFIYKKREQNAGQMEHDRTGKDTLSDIRKSDLGEMKNNSDLSDISNPAEHGHREISGASMQNSSKELTESGDLREINELNGRDILMNGTETNAADENINKSKFNDSIGFQTVLFAPGNDSSQSFMRSELESFEIQDAANIMVYKEKPIKTVKHGDTPLAKSLNGQTASRTDSETIDKVSKFITDSVRNISAIDNILVYQLMSPISKKGISEFEVIGSLLSSNSNESHLGGKSARFGFDVFVGYELNTVIAKSYNIGVLGIHEHRHWNFGIGLGYKVAYGLNFQQEKVQNYFGFDSYEREVMFSTASIEMLQMPILLGRDIGQLNECFLGFDAYFIFRSRQNINYRDDLIAPASNKGNYLDPIAANFTYALKLGYSRFLTEKWKASCGFSYSNRPWPSADRNQYGAFIQLNRKIK